MKENETPTGCCEKNCDYTLAFWLLRGWLAVRALFAGIEKFGAYKTVNKPLIDATTGLPDAGGAVVPMKMKFYAMENYHSIPPALRSKFDNEPLLLPNLTMNAFDKGLGILLIVSGLMLLVGLGTRASLFIQGLIYIALSVGLILINQNDGVAYLGIHVALIALALMLAKHNKLTLLKKW